MNLSIFAQTIPLVATDVTSFFSVCAFPYIIAFTSDSMEIRLLVNGNLVHTLSMPRLQLLASKSDVYFCSTAPEFRPATNPSCVERPSMNHNNHKNHNAAKIPMDNCSVTPNHSPPPHCKCKLKKNLTL